MSQPLGKHWFGLFFFCFSFKIMHQHLWGLRDDTVLTSLGRVYFLVVVVVVSSFLNKRSYPGN